MRQGETPQNERLDRERLDLICLEFRLPKDVMDCILPFPCYLSYTTTFDNCQISPYTVRVTLRNPRGWSGS